MKNVFLAFVFIASVVLVGSAESDNDIMFRSLIENLCSVNFEGDFGSCCSNNNNGTTVTVSAPLCFGSVYISFANEISSLDFEYQELSVIPSGAFVNFTALHSLGLNSNHLDTLVSGTFEGLINLTEIDLSFNGISAIEAGAFSTVSKLASLDLSGMSLTKLVSGTFDGLSGLTYLALASNRISEIEVGAFNGLGSLASLSLDYDSLTKIATGTFGGLNSLYSLSLNNNNIVYLEENVFGSNTKLPSVFSLRSNYLITAPQRFSSATTSGPGNLYLYYNCLDCSTINYPGTSLMCSTGQGNRCPTDTNNCMSLNKFQKDHCFTCNTTNANSFCDVCMPGYKHTVSGCGCVKCEAGETCEFGVVRNFDGPCASCTSSLPTTCSNCAKNYKYNNGDCAACGSNECCPGGGSSSVSISNCTECTEDRLGCNSCEPGTKFVRISTYTYGKCVKCGSGECCIGKNVEETCSECLEDMSGCKTCHEGKFPENGACLYRPEGECWPEGKDPAVKIEHCISCRDKEEGCALCEKEYRNQDGVCVEKNKYKSGSVLNKASVFVMGLVVVAISVIGYI